MKIEIKDYQPPSENIVMLWVDDRKNGGIECVPRKLAPLLSASPLLLALIDRATDILSTYIVPDSGITEHEAINQLLSVFDGPDYRAAMEKAGRT